MWDSESIGAGGMRADQAIAFRALAAEVMEAGMHFWILHNLVCKCRCAMQSGELQSALRFMYTGAGEDCLAAEKASGPEAVAVGLAALCVISRF